MPCQTRGCTHTVVVRANDRFTLSYRCDECDSAPYALNGTGVHSSWLAQITPAPGENGLVQTPPGDSKPPVDTEAPAKTPENAEPANIWGFK